MENQHRIKNIIFTMCIDERIEQNWKYDEQTLQLESEHYKGQCLSVVGESNVVLAKCDINNSNQKWTFNQEVELFN